MARGVRFMAGDALGLDLEGRVTHLEVLGDALFDVVEHLGGATVGEALVVDDDVRGERRQPGGDG